MYYFCLGSETVEIFFYIVSLINAIKHNEDMSEEEEDDDDEEEDTSGEDCPVVLKIFLHL